MKKSIIIVSLLSVLTASCAKEENYKKCNSKYLDNKDGIYYPTYTKKNKCYYMKGVATNTFKKIDNSNCDCL